MKMKIVSDSSANLLKIDDVSFQAVPLKINAGDREFVDDETLDVEEMVDFLQTYKGKSGTACPGVGDWMDAFEDSDIVFCLTISSKLSGSYNAATIAKQHYEEEHPGKKVYVIDTLSTGPEMKLIIEQIQKLILEGKTGDEIYEEVTRYQKGTGIVFCLESMANLANNGRVNPATAKLASILGIRVIGNAPEGEIIPQEKCRGEKRALAGIIKVMEGLGYQGGRVFIDHCQNLETAQKLEKMIKERYSAARFVFGQTRGLCSFYAEKGGLIVGFEMLPQ